ncbi:MAG TPA: redoxin family protein [Planctomycetota bacterium]|nr:redoxin family protein [Planctomycetota bacterium]
MIHLLALALLASPLQSAEGAPAAAAKPGALELGSVVPETLELVDFDGKKTTFKEWRGKAVILHFWSTRCPAEVHADPVFQKLEKHYADSKDVVMVGIASNQNELGPKPPAGSDLSKQYGEFREKIKDLGYKHPIFPDHGNALSDVFQAKTTPHCFVLDRKGTIVYSGALDDDPRGAKGEAATIYVKDAAAAVVAGKEVPVRETKSYG